MYGVSFETDTSGRGSYDSVADSTWSMIIVGLAMMKNTISINIVSNNSVTAIPREPRLLLECLVYLICSPLCESFVHYKS